MLVKRITRMTPSATIELEGTVAELERAGVPVIGLNAGEPDFPTPKNIVDACAKAVRAGKTKYIKVTGIDELRQAICDKLLKDNGAAYSPNEIVVTTGAKQSLYNAVEVLVAPGDEVIIPTPCWVSYVEMVKLAEGVPVLVPTLDNYHLDIAAIRSAITPKTKVIIVNTPCNPTGAVYSRQELLALSQLAVEHDLFVITDEVYEKLVYDGHKHVCMASFSEDIRKRCVIVNGFSKAYSMTGWRIGYCAAPAAIARGMASLQGHTTSNSTTFVQWAALEALTGQQDTVEYMRQEFDKRRQYLLQRLQTIGGIHCPNAEGAFYFLPVVTSFFGKTTPKGALIKNAADLCAYLLDVAHLAILPGSAFEAPNCVRIAYSNSIENICKGMDAMEAALSALK